MKDLTNKIALVTGSGDGIGRAIALELAKAGCDLALNDIRPEKLDEVEKGIRALGRRTLRVPADVSDRLQAESMCSAAVREFGRVDILVNNAGVAVFGKMPEIPIEDWQWIVGINLWAHIFTVRTLLPEMIKRGEGHLVHVASMAGLVSPGRVLPYGVTKFAVVGLAEGLAAEVRPTGVGVTVVCPYFVNTDMAQRARYVTPDQAVKDSFLQEGQRWTGTGASPEAVALKTVSAIRKNRFLVTTHWSTRILMVVRALFPQQAINGNAHLVARYTGRLDAGSPPSS